MDGAPSTDTVPHATPFAAMLRAGFLASAVTFPIVVIVFWITRGPSGGGAAALGALVAIVFFTAGLLVMKRVVTAHWLSVLAGALAVYLGQLIFLGVVALALGSQDWLDGVAFGLALLVVTLVWQVAQVIAFARARKPVYDIEPTGGAV
ncbi:hypothetical protein G9U51_11370 [Calidifontibacter sp. DB0510]|uniref:ATP synthase protein I n=1 Tax=Metallococcus carri TaxID=1656884 RepID=A0A967B1N4_9MICO|nr:hypothetical protein [Metallococcus carri]NHN56377.1 hypothetical protein [Metallococcus carri]NOP36001.1 hypothetical protein [Calidifontibacter sp. DB2511S]